jgi:hypothetical protein
MLVVLESAQYAFRSGSVLFLTHGGGAGLRGNLCDGVITCVELAMAGEYILAVQPCVVEDRQEHFTLPCFAVQCTITDDDLRNGTTKIAVGWAAVVQIEWTGKRTQPVTVGVNGGDGLTFEMQLEDTWVTRLLLPQGQYVAYSVSSSERTGVPFHVTTEKGVLQAVLLPGHAHPDGRIENLA